ncbi:kunitz-type U19-barytoxin-Tl1a-like [Dermacentor silvarum]|uniref:kunitz-type U19-barytoxin-Tl1a-like n=1 Tax=Dermacentor silvarum TaxID=543639 RepID=UPI0021012931|nr:kunitz-type U19-barytoxin-Tl1a-like [Dermacentor silvarum]
MKFQLLAVALIVCQISPLAALLWPPRCYRIVDSGYCDAQYLKWFYDSNIKGCKAFTYGGCGGNWNRFPSEKRCLQSCLQKLEPELVCSAKPDPGNCKAYHPMWYFDESVGVCRGFAYGGCGGNKNTFPSCHACMNRCTNYNPHMTCRYLEVEFFRKFIAGRLVASSPLWKPVQPRLSSKLLVEETAVKRS